jgi:hypothetical protein
MDIISGFDKIGTPVGLSVNGQSKFKTKIGGFLTLSYVTVTLLYSCYQTTIMIQRLDTAKIQNIITNSFDQKHVIESVQQSTEKQKNLTD